MEYNIYMLKTDLMVLQDGLNSQIPGCTGQQAHKGYKELAVLELPDLSGIREQQGGLVPKDQEQLGQLGQLV
jgi:hypothetical protein